MRTRITCVAVICSAVFTLASCDEAPDGTYQGYVEGEYIHVAPVQPGPIDVVHVRRGEHVDADALLVELDATTQQAQRDQASADFQLSQQQLERQRKLVKDNVVSKDSLDSVIATHDRNRARLAEAQWQLTQRKLKAPRAGTVEDVLYRSGEWVAAGRPIVILLPPDNIKIRFFIPEPDLGRIAVGDSVALTCTGCAEGLTAQVGFIASEVEFTPPVLFSENQQQRLVYLVEAWPTKADTRLHPGQPVTVTLNQP